MVGDYTEITITAPGSAEEGSTVSITVAIKNIIDYTIYVTPILDINGSIAEGSYETITPRETRLWPFSLIMPPTNAVLTVSSWCEDTFEWQLDYSVQHTILVTVVGAINLADLVGMIAVVMMMSMMMKIMKGV